VLAKLKCPAEARVRIVEEIARGTGTVDGMIGGQVVDLEAERTAPNAVMLEYIHRSKTGALIAASLVSGGLYAGGKDDAVVHLETFGQSIGLAFQIVDDVRRDSDIGATGKDCGGHCGEEGDLSSAVRVDESLRKADELVTQRLGLDGFLIQRNAKGTGTVSGRTKK
jgi:geranylgeranyl diphosphate synthase type II